MLSRVLTSSALLREPSRVAHELNAIGLSAKVAIIFGVNPMFLVNVSRVGFESAGTCSGFRAALLGIVVSASYGFCPGQACRLHGRRSSSRRRRSSWTASRYVAAAGRVDNLAFAKTILSQSERDCP